MLHLAANHNEFMGIFKLVLISWVFREYSSTWVIIKKFESFVRIIWSWANERTRVAFFGCKPIN
jgi:hypothetical protein